LTNSFLKSGLDFWQRFWQQVADEFQKKNLSNCGIYGLGLTQKLSSENIKKVITFHGR